MPAVPRLPPDLADVTAEDRMEAWDAARGWCVACGRRLGDQGVLHHRQAKGMGGRKGGRKSGTFHDGPPNAVILHDACHVAVHANPAAARDAGLIVSGWADPAAVPMSRLALAR